MLPPRRSAAFCSFPRQLTLIYLLMTSSSLVLKSMTSPLRVLIGCQGDLIGYHGTAVTPSRDFLCYPARLSAERSDVFQPPKRQDAFPPAGRLRTCECFRLAGVLITEGDLRQELIEILAAGKYLTLSYLTSVQAPVVQAFVIFRR